MAVDCSCHSSCVGLPVLLDVDVKGGATVLALESRVETVRVSRRCCGQLSDRWGRRQLPRLLLLLLTASVVGHEGAASCAALRRWIRGCPPSGLELFDSFDGQEESFLVSQFEETHVLQVLDGDGGHVGDAPVSLVQKLHGVLTKPDLVQPLFQRVLKYRMIVRYTSI